MNRESAMGEFYGWFETAEMYIESAANPRLDAHRQVALIYLQMAAEFTFKAAIVSISGRAMPSRDPYVLSTRCRRLVPGLQAAARIYSPKKKALFCFLDPGCLENKPVLPVADQWKQLFRLVKQLHTVMEELGRKRIDALFGEG
jgi:hypothetical protein